MKKAEAETAIRSLATTWLATLPQMAREHPSFIDFKKWLEAEGYSHYLQFRSSIGSDEEAERWFDDELGQNWRR